MPSFGTLKKQLNPFSKNFGKRLSVIPRAVAKKLSNSPGQSKLRSAWHNKTDIIKSYFPILDWGLNYRSSDLSGDIMAGMVVAIMLMPQSMAYAMLAGLPPQIGLYTAVVPLILYALFGSSRMLGVGPVAIVSLMVSHTLAQTIPELYPGMKMGTAEYTTAYIALALLLSLLSGLFLIITGFLRLGFLTNFIGHPVIAGFTTAAAMIIAFSQLKHLVGVDVPRTNNIFEIVSSISSQASQINPTTLLLSLLGIAIMLSRGAVSSYLKNVGMPNSIAMTLPKGLALALVVITTLYAWFFAIDVTAKVDIVGAIPEGLPPISIPVFDWALWQHLLPAAVLISIVGLVESLSVAKALATRKRQKIDANQEMVGLGFANLGAAFTSGYPVTGSFSRSVVNFTSGANSQLAAIITALLIAFVLIFLTPALYYLPKATLAVIIIVAVFSLIDFSPLFTAWNYYKPDGIAFVVTFLTVLAYGVEAGILAGMALSIGMFLYRISRPKMPVLGRIGNTQHFRNVERYDTNTYDNILILRVDENLFFANASYLEDRMLAEIAERPDVKHVVLVMNAVSLIDASALEALENLIDSYRDAGVLIHLAGMKGPVQDMLERTHFLKHLSPGEVFLSPHEAVLELTGEGAEIDDTVTPVVEHTQIDNRGERVDTPEEKAAKKKKAEEQENQTKITSAAE